MMFNSVSSLTYQSENDIVFTFNPTLNITLSGDSGTDLVIEDLSPGSFSDSNIITISASSNATTGYTLYSTVGSSTSNYTDLRLDSNNATNVFSSLSSNKASLSNFDDSTWGYSYCTVTSEINCNDGTSSNYWVSGNIGSTTSGYNGLPLYSSNVSTGIKLAETNNASGTSTIKFKIGVKASDSQASGIYTNTINFISVGNVVDTSYTMNYNGNGADSNVPASQSGNTTDGTIRLSSTVPVKAGHTFKGWCSVDNTSNPSTCSDITIQPGNLYAIGSVTSNFNGTVYAVWQDGKYYMQDLTPSIIAQLLPNVNSTTTVYDKRDNQAYTIAKLQDNNYWMTENLNLAGGTALDSTNTDVDSSYITSFTTSNNLTKSGGKIVLPASSTAGFNTNNYSYVYNSGNTSNCGSSGQNIPCFSYYSWDAATLGSGRSIAIDNTDAQYSICPKGWQLPTSGSQENYGWKRGDLYRLIIAYGVNLEDTYKSDTATFYNNAGPNTSANFLFAGRYNGGSFTNGGVHGGYWSSTSNNGTSYGYYLGFTTGDVYAVANGERRLGFSVRCLFAG